MNPRDPNDETTAEPTETDTSSSLVCRKCGSASAAGTEHCANPRCRAVLVGNQLARRYPKPPSDADPQVQAIVAEKRDAIIRDRGGRDAPSTLMLDVIDQLAEVELFLQSWSHYFREHGVYTRQGRVRSGYTGYLATLDRWMKLVQMIGLDRSERRVPDLDTYLAKRQNASGSPAADSPQEEAQ